MGFMVWTLKPLVIWKGDSGGINRESRGEAQGLCLVFVCYYYYTYEEGLYTGRFCLLNFLLVLLRGGCVAAAGLTAGISTVGNYTT
jgi:hypothetical protein